MLLASADFREGLWDEAQQLSDEGSTLSDAHGYHLLGWLHKYNQALLAAGRGDEESVCRLTGAMRSWAEPRGMRSLARYAAHARALAAIGQGDFEEAYRQESAMNSPGRVPQARTRRTAQDRLRLSRGTARQVPRHRAAYASAMRSAALPAISPRLAFLAAGAAAIAARDDALFETALASPGAQRWPFELARIRLAYGEHLRRSRAKTKKAKSRASTRPWRYSNGSAPPRGPPTLAANCGPAGWPGRAGTGKLSEPMNRDRQPGGFRAHQQANRREAVRITQDGGGPPAHYLPQAGHQHPRRPAPMRLTTKPPSFRQPPLRPARIGNPLRGTPSVDRCQMQPKREVCDLGQVRQVELANECGRIPVGP